MLVQDIERHSQADAQQASTAGADAMPSVSVTSPSGGQGHLSFALPPSRAAGASVADADEPYVTDII